MSIEFLPYDTTRCSIKTLRATPRGASPGISARRLAANRRNATRSTGPRSTSGKQRSSRNALKHGLCASTVCLDSEDKPTFHLFESELEQEYQPRTAMQRILFNEIVNTIWRLRRLPTAQANLFDEELKLASEKGETLTPEQVLARRFSEDPCNGFALMGRYETSLRSGLLRLMRQYEHQKKHHATTPYPDGEDAAVPREESEPAWTGDHLAAQKAAFEKRRRELDHHAPPRNEREATIDRAIALEKRTQSNPPQILTFPTNGGRCKRTHNGVGRSVA